MLAIPMAMPDPLLKFSSMFDFPPFSGAETESPGPDVDDDDYSNDGVEGDDLDGGATDGCNVFSRAQCSFPCNWTVIRDMEMPGSGLDNDFQDPCAEEEGEGFCQNTTLRSELEDNDGSGEDDVDPVDPGSGSGGPTTGDDDGGVDSVCFGLDSASACAAISTLFWGDCFPPIAARPPAQQLSVRPCARWSLMSAFSPSGFGLRFMP